MLMLILKCFVGLVVLGILFTIFISSPLAVYMGVVSEEPKDTEEK